MPKRRVVEEATKLEASPRPALVDRSLTGRGQRFKKRKQNLMEEAGSRSTEAAGGKAPNLSSKAKKRLKAQAHLHAKGEALRPAELSERAFSTDDTDHCETPFDAYRDIEPLLFRLVQVLGKAKSELRLYDPYYCEGSMRKHLASLGFPSVYNRNEDFYRAARVGAIPEHDVLVTNPPYSGDHMQRILSFCAANPRGERPFFLLMPNFVMRKSYYRDVFSSADSAPPMYLVPNTPYKFWSPGRQKFCSRFVANTRGGIGPQVPFQTIWYIGGLSRASAEALAKWWHKKYGDSAKCVLASTEEDLPTAAAPVRVHAEKRPNPRRRKALAKKLKLSAA